MIIKPVEGNISPFFLAPSASVWCGNLEMQNTKSSICKPGQPALPLPSSASQTLCHRTQALQWPLATSPRRCSCALSPAASAFPLNVCEASIHRCLSVRASLKPSWPVSPSLSVTHSQSKILSGSFLNPSRACRMSCVMLIPYTGGYLYFCHS